MKQTVKEIVEQLKNYPYQEDDWIQQLKKDERKGVQQALLRWEKKGKKERIRQKMHQKRHQFDRSFVSDHAKIAGVDEAGRGPLFGPVVTAAVILGNRIDRLVDVNDSKQLSFEERERLERLIKEDAVAYSIHIQSAATIDELNIYQATKQSMQIAVQQLSVEPELVLTDAMKLDLHLPVVDIIKGDEKSLSIAAASILAKTARDRLMREYSKTYPAYGFERNAGYGTKEHLEAIQTYGVLEEHRRTFEPIRSLLQKK